MIRKKETKFYLILGLICISYFFILLLFCDIKSFWSDDMAQMDIALQPSLSMMIKKNINIDNNPPLSHFLSYFWIRLAPYGCGWLKVMNIVFVTVGVFTCGIVAKEVYGYCAGVFASVLAVSSLSLVTLAAYTFRPYGLLFLLSAVLVWIYERSRIEFNKKKNLILFGIMLLSVYTHYFTIFVCITLFFFDLFLAGKKIIRIVDLYIYPLTAMCILPWLLIVLQDSVERLQNFWPAKPDLNILFLTVLELFGYGLLMCVVILLITVLTIKILCLLLNKQLRNDYGNVIFLSFVVILLPIFIISFTYFISKYVPGISSLFVTRYFFCILPELYIAAAGGGAVLVHGMLKIMSKTLSTKVVWVAVLFICIAAIANNGYRLYKHEQIPEEPFQESAEYLFKQNDIFEEDVLVYNTCYKREESWQYLITRKYSEDNKMRTVWFDLEKPVLEGIHKVYVVELHREFNQENQETLKKAGFEMKEKVQGLPISVYTKQNLS